MAHTKQEIQEFRTGYLEAKDAIAKGISQEQLLGKTDSPAKKAGMRRAYEEQVVTEFKDSARWLHDNLHDPAIVPVAARRFDAARQAVMDARIADTQYDFVKEDDDHYTMTKDGQPTYKQWREGGRWKCSCPAFKYHNDCKHLEMLSSYLKRQGQAEGAATRLPQHLARVRQLEQSVATWQSRVDANPSDKSAVKQLAVRKAALEEAKKKAEEIEALPKPTRHDRSEFEDVVPQLDQIFDGIADYEIVGSWRRGKDTYKDCDILTVMNPSQWEKLKERLTSNTNFGPAPGHTHADIGDDVIRGGWKNGDRVDYLDINRVTDPENYGAWLLFRTGSAEFNIACRGYLKKFGCGLNEHGIIMPDKTYMELPTEQKFFDALGIPFIDPKDRETNKKFWEEVRKIDKPAFLNDIKDSKIIDAKAEKGRDSDGNWWLQHYTKPKEGWAIIPPDNLDALGALGCDIIGPLGSDDIKEYLDKLDEDDQEIVNKLSDSMHVDPETGEWVPDADSMDGDNPITA